MTSLTSVDEITVQYNPSNKEVDRRIITSSKDSYRTIIEFFPDGMIQLQEQFAVIYLNRSNQVLGVYKMSVGGITGTIVDLRLLLSVALKTLATGIIIAHNHPSGNLKPSMADEEITQKLKSAASLMDISLLDHLILVGGTEYFSFADEGII